MNHDRKREKSSDAKLAEQKVANAAKFISYKKNLTDKALTKIRNNIHDEEGMELSQKILEINTEFYTMWNYRRDTLKKFTEEKCLIL